MAYRPVAPPPDIGAQMMRFSEPQGRPAAAPCPDCPSCPGSWDPYRSSVKFLLHYDGAAGSSTFTDSGPASRTITLSGTPTINTTTAKFGGSVQLTTNQALNLSSPFTVAGDFTFETWVYPTVRGTTSVLLKLGNESSGRFYVGLNSSGQFVYDLFGVTSGNIGTGVVALNAWSWLTVMRRSGTMYSFINGVQNGSLTRSETLGNTNAVRVFGNDFQGYADDTWFTDGVARYPSNFAPPTAPLPSQ